MTTDLHKYERAATGNVYQRRDMNRFWVLFDRVHTWKGTRVFVNGNPIKIENLWPGSPEME